MVSTASAGLRAADHAAMSAQFEQVQSIPAVMPVVYTAGPSLFYIGLSALVIHLALARQTRAWVPVLVVTGSLLPLVDKDLLPLGALCLLAASVRLVTRLNPGQAQTRQESRSRRTPPLSTRHTGRMGRRARRPSRS